MKDTIEAILDAAPEGMINNTFFEGWFNPEIEKYDDDEVVEFKKSLMDFTVELEKQHGGEVEGEDYWSVYKFSQNGQDVYVKFQGWYASYAGSEFSEWFFVEPKQVVVTQFEKTE
jgi:hypothetical protein